MKDNRERKIFANKTQRNYFKGNFSIKRRNEGEKLNTNAISGIPIKHMDITVDKKKPCLQFTSIVVHQIILLELKNYFYDRETIDEYETVHVVTVVINREGRKSKLFKVNHEVKRNP